MASRLPRTLACRLRAFLAEERGDVAISYGLIAFAIVVSIAVAIFVMGDNVDSMYSEAGVGIRREVR